MLVRHLEGLIALALVRWSWRCEPMELLSLGLVRFAAMSLPQAAQAFDVTPAVVPKSVRYRVAELRMRESTSARYTPLSCVREAHHRIGLGALRFQRLRCPGW
jgi:hypothetical protein